MDFVTLFKQYEYRTFFLFTSDTFLNRETPNVIKLITVRKFREFRMEKRVLRKIIVFK